eukprot:scaffold127841_cov28-Tisochrysis_lutea.AAC.4
MVPCARGRDTWQTTPRDQGSGGAKKPRTNANKLADFDSQKNTSASTNANAQKTVRLHPRPDGAPSTPACPNPVVWPLCTAVCL